MNPSGQAGLASIIVPCWNQLEFTRHCVAALKRHTRAPWELVVVDNGSTDGTGVYLAGVQDALSNPVTIIANSTNRGFPAAVNQGLRQARGGYLVLLNNDVVVTDGWLDQLVALAMVQAGAEAVDGRGVGLVGPMSNYAAPPQWVENAPYRDLDEMHDFARRWRDDHRGRWFTTTKLSGFCLLMKRAVYEMIGGLDERFGLGLFDDDDLAQRARQAGYELAVAGDLFVHHYGSRTFAGNGVDAEGLLEENARRFAAKWGGDAPSGRRVALLPFGDLGGVGFARVPDDSQGSIGVPRFARHTLPAVQHNAPVKVSLTMIVRDEEANLPRCLGSVEGLFDEIVVVDTGSVDRTIEIAREHGARVFDFAWVDDFAAARNAALARATGDYAFWLDADDVMEPAERVKLGALLKRLKNGDEAAYVVRCACDPGENGDGGQTVVDHIRLFPVREDVRWGYRVHEQILPALRRAGVSVRWSDVVVRHTGYADSATRARKLERDARILREELEERPEDPFTLFNLGSIAIERRSWAEALELLERSLARSAATDSITRKLYALIARARQMQGDSQGALRACAEGLAIDGEDAELWFRRAVVHRERGEPAEAEGSWRRILTLKRPERFASVDQGIYGHLTLRNLAVLARERNDHAEADRLWRAVLAECPGDREALARLDGIRQAEAVR